MWLSAVGDSRCNVSPKVASTLQHKKESLSVKHGE